MKWNDVVQFIITLAVMSLWLLGVPPEFLGWVMMIPLILGFVWGESSSWQAFIEAAMYCLTVGVLFSAHSQFLTVAVLIVTAIVSLFANFGHLLTRLSKAEAGGALRNMANGGGG